MLFPTRIVGCAGTRTELEYDVAPTRLLIHAVDGARAPITLLQNENPEAKE